MFNFNAFLKPNIKPQYSATLFVSLVPTNLESPQISILFLYITAPAPANPGLFFAQPSKNNSYESVSFGSSFLIFSFSTFSNSYIELSKSNIFVIFCLISLISFLIIYFYQFILDLQNILF